MTRRAWSWGFSLAAVLWAGLAFTVLTILGDVT